MYSIEFKSGIEKEVTDWLILNVGHKFKFDLNTGIIKKFQEKVILPYSEGNGGKLYVCKKPDLKGLYHNVVEFDNPINAELFILKFK